MCSAGDIYSAAFNAAAHGQFPDASCGTGSQFWTCAEGNTFLGCCKSNPCSQGAVCPKSDLEPALLSRDDLRIAYGAVSAVSSSAASSTRASSIESSTASRSSSIISPTSTNTSPAAMTTSSAQNDGPPVAAIAGGAAGGAFVLAMIIGLVIFCVCRKRRSRRGPEKERQSDQPEMATVMHTQKDTFDPADGKCSPHLLGSASLTSFQHLQGTHHQSLTSTTTYDQDNTSHTSIIKRTYQSLKNCLVSLDRRQTFHVSLSAINVIFLSFQEILLLDLSWKVPIPLQSLAIHLELR